MSTVMDVHPMDFSQFVSVERERFVQFAYGLCWEWSTAEDITQEMLIELLRRWQGLDASRGAPIGYARSVLRTKHIDRLRKASCAREVVADQNDDLVGYLDQRLGQVEQFNQLRKLLLLLPFDQRQVLFLYYWMDLSSHEISSVVGVAAGSVRSRHSRALAELRKSLACLGAP